jgi:hypothetical protein
LQEKDEAAGLTPETQREARAYAKSLYLQVDEQGVQCYTCSMIAQKVKQKFGWIVHTSTVYRWAKRKKRGETQNWVELLEGAKGNAIILATRQTTIIQGGDEASNAAKDAIVDDMASVLKINKERRDTYHKLEMLFLNAVIHRLSTVSNENMLQEFEDMGIDLGDLRRGMDSSQKVYNAAELVAKLKETRGEISVDNSFLQLLTNSNQEDALNMIMAVAEANRKVEQADAAPVTVIEHKGGIKK